MKVIEQTDASPFESLCLEIQERTGALLVFLLVGTPDGISATVQAAPGLASEIPYALRQVADQLDRDAATTTGVAH